MTLENNPSTGKFYPQSQQQNNNPFYASPMGNDANTFATLPQQQNAPPSYNGNVVPPASNNQAPIYPQQPQQFQQDHASNWNMPPLPQQNQQQFQQQPPSVMSAQSPGGYQEPPPLSDQPSQSQSNSGKIEQKGDENSFLNKYLRNEYVVALLNLLIPGVGYFVIEQHHKGLFALVGGLILLTLTAVLSEIYIGFFLLLPYAFYSVLYAVDAGMLALKLKREGFIYRGECFHKLVTFGMDFVLRRFVTIFVSGSERDPRNAF